MTNVGANMIRDREIFLQADDRTPAFDVTWKCGRAVATGSQACQVVVVEPAKHTVDVLPDGTVLLNGGSTGDPPIGELASLTNLLGSLKASADRLGKKTVVTIQADPFSPHRRSIDVLNACARANLKYVSFAQM
mgnify:CR=1 FL=1